VQDPRHDRVDAGREVLDEVVFRQLGTAELERGLDILLTGLAATLSPPGN
jgi:hypothetical protein